MLDEEDQVGNFVGAGAAGHQVTGSPIRSIQTKRFPMSGAAGASSRVEQQAYGNPERASDVLLANFTRNPRTVNRGGIMMHSIAPGGDGGFGFGDGKD